MVLKMCIAVNREVFETRPPLVEACSLRSRYQEFFLGSAVFQSAVSYAMQRQPPCIPKGEPLRKFKPYSKSGKQSVEVCVTENQTAVLKPGVK